MDKRVTEMLQKAAASATAFRSEQSGSRLEWQGQTVGGISSSHQLWESNHLAGALVIAHLMIMGEVLADLLEELRALRGGEMPGRREKEIARRLGIASEDAVRKALRRARARVLARLRTRVSFVEDGQNES